MLSLDFSNFRLAMMDRSAKILARRKLSYDLLANEIGISTGTLSNILGLTYVRDREIKTITVNTYIRCCSWLGCSLYKYIKDENTLS